MNKLLSANLSRLRKNKWLWIYLFIMFVVSAANMLNGCRQAAMEVNVEYYLDSYYFNLAPVIGLFVAVFISQFLGTEYSDGTIRNKIIVGHTRSHIYIGNLLTSMLASLLFVVVWWIGGLVGIPYLKSFEMGLLELIIYLLISVFFTIALSAIFTVIGTLSSNKAASAVITILLFLGLLLFVGIIDGRLNEPELNSNIIITTENGMQMGNPMPNPYYITGTKRIIYDLILNIVPTGQSILMAGVNIARPILQVVSSILITVLVSVCGIILFRKKDLK